MNDEPKKGRILRVLSQVAQAEREQAERHREWVEQKRSEGCPDPENPVVLAAWQLGYDKQCAEEYADFKRMMDEEDEELERIRDSRPLGVPPPIEPRSIHSSVPQPPWKRKLRP